MHRTYFSCFILCAMVLYVCVNDANISLMKPIFEYIFDEIFTPSYYLDALLCNSQHVVTSSPDSSCDLHRLMHCTFHLCVQRRTKSRGEILSLRDHHFRSISTSRSLCRTDYMSDWFAETPSCRCITRIRATSRWQASGPTKPSCVIDNAQPLWLEKSHYNASTSFPNIKKRKDQKQSIFPWQVHYENYNTSRSIL